MTHQWNAGAVPPEPEQPRQVLLPGDGGPPYVVTAHGDVAHGNDAPYGNDAAHGNDAAYGNNVAHVNDPYGHGAYAHYSGTYAPYGHGDDTHAHGAYAHGARDAYAHDAYVHGAHAHDAYVHGAHAHDAYVHGAHDAYVHGAHDAYVHGAHDAYDAYVHGAHVDGGYVHGAPPPGPVLAGHAPIPAGSGPGDTWDDLWEEDGPEERPRRRPVRRLLLALLVAVVAVAGGGYGWVQLSLDRSVKLADGEERPPGNEGTNYLIVGSDSREGLTGEDMDELHTGAAEGRRTDSMMLLHTGEHGPTMVSLPRDSWVTFPARLSPSTGKRHPAAPNKLNAAYAIGGPKLLTKTIERNTGVRIDHYAEIGFAGFVNIVDSVGGVRMCLDKAVKDEKSGADLEAGCQVLGGKDALAFVRQRHQEAKGDLGRSANQQKLLSALAQQATQKSVLLNPGKMLPTAEAGLDTLVVDEEMGLDDLMTMAESLQGVTGGSGGKQVHVPVGKRGLKTDKGSALLWDRERAHRLFEQLRTDQPVTEPATP